MMLLQIITQFGFNLKQFFHYEKGTFHRTLKFGGLFDNKTWHRDTATEEFAACLLIKDDNHYLIEWLAYHYHRLPLRRLIVAVDPTSVTSPTSILDRYRNLGLINITQWKDEDFWPEEDRKNWQLDLQSGIRNARRQTDLHVHRQTIFCQQCMRQLKTENWTWTAFVDVDEYILPNRNVKEAYRIPGQDSTATIFQLLETAKTSNISNMLSSPCIHAKRILFGSKESEPHQVEHSAPQGFNVSNLLTFRWRWHESYSDTFLGKCILDLSRVNASVHLDIREINIHRIVRSLCPKATMYISYEDSSLLVHHYVGSWEQWSFRSDPRSGLGWTRTREVFEKRKVNFGQDESAREWLKSFVDKEGRELASLLLEGAGLLNTAYTAAKTNRKFLKSQTLWWNNVDRDL